MKLRVGGILIEDSNILLSRHRRSARAYWSLPGGGVEEGETVLAALQREWLEETGMHIGADARLIWLHDVITPRGVGRQRHIVHAIFAVRRLSGYPLEPVILQRGEHLDHAEWVSMEALPELVLLPPMQSEILRWAESTGNSEPASYLGDLWMHLDSVEGLI